MARKFQSPADMLAWQYRSILEELNELQRHASDPSCPCMQSDQGEYCLHKHSLGLHTLAKETASMDPANLEMLETLAVEALDQHNALKDRITCGKEHKDEKDTVKWARSWRKRIEPVYYSCGHKAKLQSDSAPAKPEVKISGKCTGTSCDLKVKATESVQRHTGINGVEAAVDKVLSDLEKRRRPVASHNTFAIGPNTLTRYTFEYKLVEADDLVASHDPHTFQPNPRYPEELQPRLRGRAASKAQIQHMSAHLDADSLLTEFHAIDRGAPIVGPDNVVESGNGRVMALQLAITDFPDSYARYRIALETALPAFGIKSAAKFGLPILVRMRTSDADRRRFVEEANSSTVLTASAVETARSDAAKITPAMLDSLSVSDGQGIEDALRASANNAFIARFMEFVPAFERGQLTDPKGLVNQEAIRRIVMALFVFAFPGPAGLKLAEGFFEITETGARNVFNGILASLGRLVQGEAAARAKYPDLMIGEDLALATMTFAQIKKTAGMTVEKYLAQIPLLEKNLTSFQERFLSLLNERSRSGKRIAVLLRAYADVVMEAPPPNQASMIALDPPTKEGMLDLALRRESSFSAMMQASLGVVEVDTCNLSDHDKETVWSWRPLRDFIVWGSAAGNLKICRAGLTEGAYQVTIGGLAGVADQAEAVLRAKAIPTAKRVYTPEKEVVYQVVIPQNPNDLTWGAQKLYHKTAEDAEQARLFSPDPIIRRLAPALCALGERAACVKQVCTAASSKGGRANMKKVAEKKVADLSVKELEGLIEKVVDRKLEEMLRDSDAGLELSDELRESLEHLRSSKDPWLSADQVAAELGLK